MGRAAGLPDTKDVNTSAKCHRMHAQINTAYSFNWNHINRIGYADHLPPSGTEPLEC